MIARINCPITEQSWSLVDSYSGLVKRNRSLVAKRDQTHSISMQNGGPWPLNVPPKDLIPRVTFAVSEMKQNRADIIMQLPTT